jgi:hypothetical protein
VAAVNRVYLMGVVATPPGHRGDAWEFVIGVPEERAGRSRFQRIRVVARGLVAEAVQQLRTAQPVYADGRLTHSPDGAVVEATSVVALGDPPPDPIPPAEPTSTHASPRAHDRAGHPRRLYAGTSRERVVWVRPTRVGAAGGSHHPRRRR